MKPNPSIADRKVKLTMATEKYKKAIENQVGDLRANAGKIGKNALIIGGTLLVSYALVKLMLGKDKSKKIPTEENSRFLPAAPLKRESRIVSMIKQQIAMFLLGIAKQRISEFIERKRSAK